MAPISTSSLPLADRLYLTRIDAEFAGDAFFPPIDPADWIETERQSARSADGWSYAFITMERADPQLSRITQ